MPLRRLPQRTPRELLTDSILTLTLYYLCGLVSQDSMRIGDRLKAAKLTFYSTYPCYRQGIKALNYSFQKFTHGPFTRELYETWGSLQWDGFCEKFLRVL